MSRHKVLRGGIWWELPHTSGGEALRVLVNSFPSDTEYITLYPIADVHWGAAECMEKEFKDHLKQVASDPSGYILLVGDLINNALKSSVSDVYKEKYSPRQQKHDIVEMLFPVRDKILGVVGGNHERRTSRDSDQDITEDICRELGIGDKYLHDAGFLKLSLGKMYNRKPATYTIYISHGSGGGASLGAGISRQDSYHMTIEGVDISVTGHTHKPTKTPSGRLILDAQNNLVRRSKTLLFVCTSWLDYDGYPLQAQLKAAAFHPDTIRLDGRKKHWT